MLERESGERPKLLSFTPVLTLRVAREAVSTFGCKRSISENNMASTYNAVPDLKTTRAC